MPIGELSLGGVLAKDANDRDDEQHQTSIADLQVCSRRFHFDRVAGRDRHHQHPRKPPSTGVGQVEREGAPHPMFQQSKAIAAGAPDVCGRQ